MQFCCNKEAAQKAFNYASIKPSDIDLVELHDCFSIAEIIDSEDIGFMPKDMAVVGRGRVEPK